MLTMDNFIERIENELARRGWQPADLARASGLPDATISNILNQKRKAGPTVCRAIARGLSIDEEEIFRWAGLLSSLPPPVAEEREAIRILRQLPEDTRATILQMLRSLTPSRDSLSAIAEDRTVYHYTVDDEAR